MSELNTNGSGEAPKEADESKFRHLMELYRLRNAAEQQRMRLRTQSISDKIKEGFDAQLIGLNRRAVKAFEAKEANKKARADYREGLEAINTEFGNRIKQITADIRELREQRTALLLSQESCKDTIRRMQASVAQFQMTDKDGNIESVTKFRDLLQSTQREATELKKAQKGIQQQIEKIDGAIRKKAIDRERAYNEREAKIEEVQNTKDNSLQKRSFISRIMALFAGGAQARAEALAKRIEDRNRATQATKEQLEEDYQKTEQAIKAQKEEIRAEVSNTINNMKGAVVGFGKNVVGLGAKVLDYIGATYDLIGASTKGAVQNIVRKVFDRLQAFSSQESIAATRERAQKARKTLRGENRAGNEGKEAGDTGEIN